MLVVINNDNHTIDNNTNTNTKHGWPSESLDTCKLCVCTLCLHFCKLCRYPSESLEVNYVYVHCLMLVVVYLFVRPDVRLLRGKICSCFFVIVMLCL